MKYSLPIIALFASKALSAALPGENSGGWEVLTADEAAMKGLPIVDLQITDPRFPGQTFSGTAESVYRQMKELKPELFINDTVTPLELSGSSETGIEKRQHIDCNWGDKQGGWNACIDGIGYLMNLGTAWCGVNAAPACARVSCSHNCGLFLCNKLDHHLQVHCGDIPADVQAIGNACVGAAGLLHGSRHFGSHFIGISMRQGC